MTAWKLELKVVNVNCKLLKAMWQFLQDAPTHRALCENTVTLEYPSKFCVHHWSENKKKQSSKAMISFTAAVLGIIMKDFFQ